MRAFVVVFARRAAIARLGVLVVAGDRARIRSPSEAARPKPFDSNGKDDSFAIAMSRAQGPLITRRHGRRRHRRRSARCRRRRRSGAGHVRAPGRLADHADPRRADARRSGDVVRHRPQRRPDRLLRLRRVGSDASAPGAEAHQTLPNGSATDIFCSSQLVLLERRRRDVRRRQPAGRARNTSNDDVTQYRPATQHARAHRPDEPAALVLDGDDAAQRRGAGPGRFAAAPTSPRCARPTGRSACSPAHRRPTCRAATRRTSSDPTARCSGSPTTRCTASIRPAPDRSPRSARSPPTTVGGTSTSVMFRPGRILQVGGGNANTASDAGEHHRHQRRHTAGDGRCPTPSSGATGATPR